MRPVYFLWSAVGFPQGWRIKTRPENYLWVLNRLPYYTVCLTPHYTNFDVPDSSPSLDSSHTLLPSVYVFALCFDFGNNKKKMEGRFLLWVDVSYIFLLFDLFSLKSYADEGPSQAPRAQGDNFKLLVFFQSNIAKSKAIPFTMIQNR